MVGIADGFAIKSTMPDQFLFSADTLRALQFAVGHINVSVREQITSEDLFGYLKGRAVEPRHRHHFSAFFDETDTATISDLVLGGDISYCELSALSDRILPDGHPTREWLHERA